MTKPVSKNANSQWKVEKCTDCHWVHCSVNKSIKNLTGNKFPKISCEVCEQILKTVSVIYYKERIPQPELNRNMWMHRQTFIKMHGKTIISPQHCHPDTGSYPSTSFPPCPSTLMGTITEFPRLLCQDGFFSVVIM